MKRDDVGLAGKYIRVRPKESVRDGDWQRRLIMSSWIDGDVVNILSVTDRGQLIRWTIPAFVNGKPWSTEIIDPMNDIEGWRL